MELDLTPIVERAKAAQKIDEEDYIGEDGFLHCGKCGTPKECYTDFFGRTPCICKCEYDAEVEQKRRETAEQYRTACFSSPRLRKITFENGEDYHPEATRILKQYVENFDAAKKEGWGVLLYGEFGTGKSHLAYQTANALIDKCRRVKVTQFETLYREMEQERNKNVFLASLCGYDLIVLDDLGAEKKSPAMRSFVFDVIDTLYRAHRPFLITTNLALSELKDPPDANNCRTYDRILERCPAPIEVGKISGNLRHKIIRETHGEYKKLLGIK